MTRTPVNQTLRDFVIQTILQRLTFLPVGKAVEQAKRLGITEDEFKRNRKILWPSRWPHHRYSHMNKKTREELKAKLALLRPLPDFGLDRPVYSQEVPKTLSTLEPSHICWLDKYRQLEPQTQPVEISLAPIRNAPVVPLTIPQFKNIATTAPVPIPLVGVYLVPLQQCSRINTTVRTDLILGADVTNNLAKAGFVNEPVRKVTATETQTRPKSPPSPNEGYIQTTFSMSMKPLNVTQICPAYNGRSRRSVAFTYH